MAKSPAIYEALQTWTSSPNVAKKHVKTVLGTNESASQAEKLVQQGKSLYDASKYTEAVKVLRQAAADFKEAGDGLREAMTLSNLSLADQQLGLWTQAQKAIRNAIASLNAQCLNILPNLDNSRECSAIQAKALDVQGRLQFMRGQAQEALTTWQKAADIYQQLGERAALTRNRINSAQALQTLGLYRQANKMLIEVEQTLKNQPDSALVATGLLNLGNVLRFVGDLRESLRVLEQTLALAKASSLNQIVSETLLSLGNTARAQQDTQAALNYYKQARAASVNSNTRIQAQLNQLSLLTQTKEFSDALALSKQIQPEISKLSPSRMAVDAKINFAESLMKLGRGGGERGRGGEGGRNSSLSPHPSSTTVVHTRPPCPHILPISVEILAKAVKEAQDLEDKRAESYAVGTMGELYEQTRQFSDAQKLTQKALFTAQSINASDIAYQWEWQLGRLFKQQGDVKGALSYYSQAFKTLQSLRSDLVAINPDIQFSFRQSVEPVYREFVELLLQSQGNFAPNSENLKIAREVIESLQLAELDNFFRSACINPKQGIDLLVDKKDQTAAVFYPIILPNRLEVILKLPNQELRHYKTAIPQQKVENIVAELRKDLRDVAGTVQVKQQSQQVYDWLIRPVSADLAKSGIKTLVFVLDGSLRNIPMGVLYDKQQQKYLIEKYAIALAPGLQLLDPKPLQKVRLNALTGGVAEERSIDGQKFSSLQNVARELQRIQSQVPDSEKLLNQNFTETNLRKQLQTLPVSVVHLATHGEFSSDPEKTFILTWDRLLKVKDFDTLLRVSDQSRSSTIELLVLSACKTAEGDDRAALGLAGIAVRAGARTTLATLWSVDDESTANLMSEFYQQLNVGLNKAEALQRAQLAVFAQEKRPFFWAPFVLVGNWL
ncbi:MAG: CHAT domain-containing protein [Heteroscytonema crispum UTEX LB 1556]